MDILMSLKRIGYILSLLLLSIVLLGGVGMALLSSSDLQTRAVELVTKELSSGVGANMKIGKVDYRLPATLKLEDIYVEDRQQDTLLYVHEVYARLRIRDLFDNVVNIQKTRIDGAYLNLHDNNYAFLSPLLQNNQSDSLPVLKTLITAPNIEVSDTRLRYDDYYVNVHDLQLKLNVWAYDTLNVELKDLQGEYIYQPHLANNIQPLTIKHLHTEVLAGAELFRIPDLQLRLPHSSINLDDIILTFPDILWDGFSKKMLDETASQIQVFLKLDDLTFCPKDFAMVVPELSVLDEPLHIQAQMKGRLDSLVLHQLNAYYNHQHVLAADVVVRGLPDLNNTYVNAHCRDFYVNAGIIQDAISDITDTPFNLPASVRNLGAVHYRGQLCGMAQELTLRGAFRTALGAITTDGDLRFDSTFTSLTFQGGLGTKGFHLGRVLGNEDVGDISLDVNTSLKLTPTQLQAQVKTLISEFTFREYTYRDIALQGHATNTGYAGAVTINDSNIVFSSKVNAEQQGDHYALNLEMGLEKCLLGPLHLSKRYTDASVATQIKGHATFSSIEDLNAELVVNSLSLRNGADSIEMSELKFTHQATEDHSKLIQITSDYLAGTLTGQLEYTTLLTTIEKQAIRYMPQLFGKQTRQRILAKPSNNNFRFYLYGRELKHLQRVLKLPVRISDYPVMKGYVSEESNHWVLQGYIPSLNTGKQKIEDITFATDNLGERANVDFSAKAGYTKLVLHSFAQEDSCRLALSIKNVDPHRDDSTWHPVQSSELTLLQQESFIEGDVMMSAHFTQYAGYPLVDVHLYPSYLQYGDSVYHIDDARLSYCVADTLLTVEHFRIGTRTQFIEAQGTGSPAPEDELSVQLGQLEAGYFINFLLPTNALTVQGKVTGWAKAYSLFSAPAVEAEVEMKNAGLNGYPIGDATGKLTLDRSNYNIIIDADVEEEGRHVAHMDGLVETLGAKNWGLDIYPDSLSVAFINHWTNGFIDQIEGRAYGEVNVFGYDKMTWVTAKAYADSVGLTIPYTGCRYFVSDSVFLDSTAIRFPDMVLTDVEGNTLLVDGVLNHDEYFKDFKFNIFARPNNALVFSLPYQQGEMLSGKTYASGEVYIGGDEELVTLNATARTMGNSHFRFNVSYASSASDNSFITFYDRNDVSQWKQEDDDDLDFGKPEQTQSTRFKMALNVDIQPNLLFGLVLNERTGDEIKARGDGAITIGYDDQTEIISMLGTYTVQSGTMGFTVGNMIRRDFTLVDGGQIVWSGAPEMPMLDVTANYLVTASLKDLFGSDVTSVATSRTNIPVTTSINLKGTLDNPQIRFALSLPQSEQEIADKVKTIINTEEMLMRQVIYLLVFGRFYTPDYMASTNTMGTNEMYSLVSSTITGQINNWIGKLTDAFSMGVNVRKDGQGAQASYEAEAKFQLQPIDRLIINGDLGYRYNDITNRPFFGDADVEYMLTKNGKFRVKAYTHMVDKYSLRQASTIQGVGFVFKHDFNWRKPKKKKQ